MGIILQLLFIHIIYLIAITYCNNFLPLFKHFFFLENENGAIVSPFHDIPLLANGGDGKVFNMVVEIPRWSNAKMEVRLALF